MKRNLSIILVLLAMIIGYGCEGTEEESISTAAADAGVQTASIGVTASMDSSSSSRMMNALGTANQITSITVSASLAADNTVITSTTLENIEGTWEGTLTTLPYNTRIKFTAMALNSDGTAIFSGTLTKTLVSGADNDIVISLSSIDDGVEPDNPVITSISMPEKILVDSEPQLITMQISHTASVTYTIAVTSGGLSASFQVPLQLH